MYEQILSILNIPARHHDQFLHLSQTGDSNMNFPNLCIEAGGLGRDGI
jgi:hypothetical protein